MTKFQELSELAFGWRDAGQSYWIRVYDTASKLAHDFGTYIEAPGAYKNPDTGRMISYVKIMRHGYDEQTDRPIPVEAESIQDVFQVENDGYATFSISTLFEVAPGHFPKLNVGVFLRIKIIGDVTQIELLNKSYVPFAIEPDKPETRTKFFNAIIDLLEESFKRRPGDDSKLPSIGFALTAEP